jgi:hypothetical protein
MSSMYRALAAITAASLSALTACAQQPAPAVRYAHDAHDVQLQAANDTEAQAIEAAKRHPNAQPRVRPQYPEQAPPALTPGTNLPEPLYASRRAASKAADRAADARDAQYERALYAASAYNDYRYGYGYSYRRPFFSAGWGYGWDPYNYGYYGAPGFRYGYGLSLGAGHWGSSYYRYPSYGRLHWPGRFGWGGGGHQHWGSHHHGWHGGASGNTRWLGVGRSGRRW